MLPWLQLMYYFLHFRRLSEVWRVRRDLDLYLFAVFRFDSCDFHCESLRFWYFQHPIKRQYSSSPHPHCSRFNFHSLLHPHLLLGLHLEFSTLVFRSALLFGVQASSRWTQDPHSNLSTPTTPSVSQEPRNICVYF